MPQGNSYASSTPVSTGVSAFGETKSITAWARDERCPVSAPAIRKRLKAGWSPEEAISTPAADRTRKVTPDGRVKPKKPNRHFPLYAHNSGRWAKRIRGEVYYFGDWSDPNAALELYLEQKDDLLAGRKPRERQEGATVRDLCNRFLTDQEVKRETGELTERSFSDYKRTCQHVVDAFGRNRVLSDLGPRDFADLRAKLAKGKAVTTLANEVGRVRVLFNYAYESDLLKSPIKYGAVFKKPTKKVLRRYKQQSGEKLFDAPEIHAVLGAASDQLRAMILLGINCGFGNHDCGKLPRRAIDLNSSWVRFPRPKTGVERSCPLWPETVEALRAVLANRPTPTDPAHDELVFITKYGKPWSLDRSANPISAEFRKLITDLGIYRKGLSFYVLRHTFETIAGDARDQVAVNHVMGHVDDSMAAVYRERIDDARLHAVVDHVRRWLFGSDESRHNSK